jgi:transcriptional regulator with XRE-family HTH domain
MELKQRFGMLVKAHRQRQGMTQADLATAAGMSDTMISRIELGASGARFPNIQHIANALGVDPAELFIVDRPPGGETSTAKINLAAMLAGLSEEDTVWIASLVDAALQKRRG